MRLTIGALFTTCLLCGQEDLVSIQAAIDKAVDGQEIRVPPGRYEERIDFKGKSISVVAWDFDRNAPGTPRRHHITPPPEDGVMESVVTMGVPVVSPNGDVREMVLEGFSIRDGTAWQGGGISIRGNVLAEVYRCEIAHNYAREVGDPPKGGDGGGIFVDAVASATILSCAIAYNRADGRGGAVYVAPGNDGEPSEGTICIVNCTITRNQTGARPGGAVFFSPLTREPCIYNNIIWGNLPEDQAADLSSTNVVIGHCNLLGITANVDCQDCVTGSPEFLFTSESPPPTAADRLGWFRLTAESPAINRACDASQCLVRPLGRRADSYDDIMGRAPVGGRDCGTDEYFIIFVRADSNVDTNIDQGDPIHILQYLFVRGSPLPPCADAADINDDGALDIADGIYGLYFLWAGGAPPLPPFPCWGEDPTEDDLNCEYYPEPPGDT